jgi:hypothetical protein
MVPTRNFLLCFADHGEIVRGKFDFNVVGHDARHEVLSLMVNNEPKHIVSFDG